MGKRLATILMIVSPFVLLPVAAAYVQWGVLGLPALPPGPATTPETASGAVRLPGLAPHHPLRQLPVPDPTHP